MNRAVATAAAAGAGSSWLQSVREAMASPSLVGLVAALVAGWQSAVRSAPDDVIIVVMLGTMAAVTDSVVGSLVAKRAGNWKLTTCLWMLGDKVSARVGVGVISVVIGYKLGNIWSSVSATMWAFVIFEALSALRHIRSIRAESTAELVLVDAMIDLLGKIGQRVHDVKTASQPAEKPLPNGVATP